MPIDTLAKSYQLVPITVKPAQLLLDPNNPRIAFDLNLDRAFAPAETQKPEIQIYIRNALLRKSNNVTGLIRGMRETGFTYGGGKILVQKVGGTNKYLVLEGNRRTAAVQSLLEDSAQLSPIVHASLVDLHAEEFIYQPRAGHTEAEAIEHLMRVHMDPTKPWPVFVMARVTYLSYLQKLVGKYGTDNFRYDLGCANQVAILYNSTPKEVKNKLIIYRIYQQLLKQEYSVNQDDYTLIDLAVSSRGVGSEYFGLHPDRCELTKEGLRKFNLLCLQDSCPINNPGDFRKFARIVRAGNEGVITLVERGLDLDKALKLVNQVNAASGLLDRLEGVLTGLQELRVEEFRGTTAEKSAIRSIKKLVVTKLIRLLKPL